MVFDEKDIEAIADRRTSRQESKKVNNAIYIAMALVLAGWFTSDYSRTLSYILMGLGIAGVFYMLYYYLPSKQKGARFLLLQEWYKERKSTTHG